MQRIGLSRLRFLETRRFVSNLGPLAAVFNTKHNIRSKGLFILTFLCPVRHYYKFICFERNVSFIVLEAKTKS